MWNTNTPLKCGQRKCKTSENEIVPFMISSKILERSTHHSYSLVVLKQYLSIWDLGMLYLEDRKQTGGYLGNDVVWYNYIIHDAVFPLKIFSSKYSKKFNIYLALREIGLCISQFQANLNLKIVSFGLRLKILSFGLRLKMFIFWSETENVYLQEIRESDNPEENWGRISQISQMKNLKGKHWDTSLSRDFYFCLVWSGGSI